MIRERASVDVSHVPTVAFGPRSLLWWGTVGFMVIEGFTLLLMVVAYVYLRRNEVEWPPAPYAAPDLLVPTLNTLLLVLLVVPMRSVDRAAKRFDRGGVTRGLAITAVLTAVVAVLRWFELTALNVSYDTNAYGSAAWGIVALHGTLIAFDLAETATMAVLFYVGHAQKKHFSDASDAALYQYFLSLVWIPLYLVVYWGPRFL